MDYVEELIKLAGNLTTTFENPSDTDWNLLESSLGWNLPFEFKELLSKLGSGSFGLDFYLLNPKSIDETQLSVEKFFEYCSTASPLMERVNLHLFPLKDGALRIGHLSTRKDLFVMPVGDRYLLQVCDYDDAVTIDLNLGVAEFIYKLYKGELPSLYMENLRRLVWSLQSVRFFSPCKSSSSLLKVENVRHLDGFTNLCVSMEEQVRKVQDLLNRQIDAE